MNEFPSWLKSMQNGTIGEARTKAFLIDRFWILERSVDIHGVDFIIQRRLCDRNILDEEPPRFGVVQAKFSHDENTCHYINKECILDKDSSPRIEAFLIIHTGDEEDQRMFLLTSKDITEDFSINKDKFVVPSRKVFSSSKYQIKNRRLSLDRMEALIQCAEFYKNRNFVFSRLSSMAPDFDAILPEYKEGIEHRFGDIPDLFKNQKKEAFKAMLEIEEIHKLLREFVESIDPIEACYIAEGLNHRFGISISMPEVFNKDFYYGAKNLKEMVDNMRNDGTLDNYISARKYITSEIHSFLQNYSIDKIDRNTIHEITIKYNPANFTFIDISNSMSYIPEEELYKEFSKVVEAKEGSIILSWKIGLQVNNDGYIRMNDCCMNDIMERIYNLKYCEGNEI